MSKLDRAAKILKRGRERRRESQDEVYVRLRQPQKKGSTVREPKVSNRSRSHLVKWKCSGCGAVQFDHVLWPNLDVAEGDVHGWDPLNRRMCEGTWHRTEVWGD